MTIDKMAVLSRLNGSEPSELGELAKVFLADEDTFPLSDKPVQVKVSEALRLWRTRLRNTAFTGQPIHGGELLVAQLQTLNPDLYLEQISFVNAKRAGNLFFENESGKFVGLAIVIRPQKSSS